MRTCIQYIVEPDWFCIWNVESPYNLTEINLLLPNLAMLLHSCMSDSLSTTGHYPRAPCKSPYKHREWLFLLILRRQPYAAYTTTTAAAAAAVLLLLLLILLLLLLVLLLLLLLLILLLLLLLA